MYRLCSCIEFLYQPASKLLLTAIVISITHSNSNNSSIGRERKRWKAGRKEEGRNRERGAEREGGRDRKERK